MKTVAVVPIKLTNRRLPNKNIKEFTDGKPLCSYILETLKRVEGIDEVYVYCSDSSIVRYLPSNVGFIQRDKKLDADTASMTEVLKCFAKDVRADIYVMAHTTAPFIKASSIQEGLSRVMSLKYDSAFSAKIIQDFLWEENAIAPLNYDLNNIPRTQDLKPLLMETSGFYIYTRAVINSLGRRIGRNPYIVKVGEIEGIDIDEEEDFSIADAVYSLLRRKDRVI